MFWRNLLRRDESDREWREEMESHLQILTDSFVAEGLSPEDARSAALKQVGNLSYRREEIYQMNGIQWLDSFSADVRYAVRSLLKHKPFTAVAVLTLALGIGANTAVFSVINSVLLKPLPFPNPEQLVDLAQVAPGAGGIVNSRGTFPLSASMYFTYTEQNRSFQSMGVWTLGVVTITGLGEPQQVFANSVSDGLLEALAVPPEIGRPLTAADQVPGSNATVLLTHGYWMRRFGGDRSAIGRTVLVDARPREIVGVMPAGFRIANTSVDLILPLQLDRGKADLPGFGLESIARLKPGTSVEQANADIRRLIPVWLRSWPSSNPLTIKLFTSWRISPNIKPLRDSLVGNVRSVLWVVMATLAMVMLIACANVANLMLVRVESRHSELALRAALGASWLRIVRQLLTESLLLGVAGGTLGAGIASAGLKFLVSHGPSNLPRLNEIALDSSALAFNVVVSLLSALFFGLIPALRYAGPRVSLNVRDSGRTASAGRERHRARNVLVVVQVSLAVILLISSGLMIRTFAATRSVQLGFQQPDTLQTFRVAIPEDLIKSDLEVTRIEQSIGDKIAAIPGVDSVGFSDGLPMDGVPTGWDGILKEGQSYEAGNRPPMSLFLRVSPGLFGALGTRVKAGRDLTWTDIYGDRRVILLSENLARQMFGSADSAVGKLVRSNDADVWREVIGVVEDVHHAGAQDPAPAIVYWPALSRLHYRPVTVATRSIAFAVRSTRAGTASFLSEIRQAVWSVNAALPVASPETMRQTAERSMARTSFALAMLAIAGAMALVLGLVGLYGVIAYAVVQRRREIGIRLALGGRPSEIRQMFVRHGLSLCAIGIVIGLGIAAALTRLLKSLLFGVAPMDPVTFAAVPVALLLATLAACYTPARRAAEIDPIECIKAE